MKRFIVICALSVFLVSGALADEISLKNGNKLTGSIVYIDETELKIETAYGTLDIPRADIQSACLGAPSIPATTSGYDKNKNGYKRTPNAAISGHNTRHLAKASVQECMNACDKEPWCKSFDFYKGQGSCDLSNKKASEVGGLKKDYPHNPYDYYEKVGDAALGAVTGTPGAIGPGVAEDCGGGAECTKPPEPEPVAPQDNPYVIRSEAAKRIVGKWRRGDGYLRFYASGFVKASYDNNKNRSWRYTGDNRYAYIGPQGEKQEILLLKNGTVLHFSNGHEWHKVN